MPYHLSITDVMLHDLSYLFRCPHAVPDAFRIDDHRGTECAGIKTPRFVGADSTLQTQALNLLFECIPQCFRSLGRTASPRICRLSTIFADENMMLKSRQEPSFLRSFYATPSNLSITTRGCCGRFVPSATRNHCDACDRFLRRYAGTGLCLRKF